MQANENSKDGAPPKKTRGLSPRVEVLQADLNQILPILGQADEDLSWIAAHTAAALQVRLLKLANSSFGSFKNNREFFIALRRILTRINYVFACPSCGQPSRMHLSSSLSASGQFKMKHLGKQGQYCWTGTYLPVMTLIPHPDMNEPEE